MAHHALRRERRPTTAAHAQQKRSLGTHSYRRLLMVKRTDKSEDVSILTRLDPQRALPDSWWKLRINQQVAVLWHNA